MTVYITDLAGFLPNAPVGNDEIEQVLGMVGGKPSRSLRLTLRNNGIQTRYYAIDPRTGRYTHNNAQMAAESVRNVLQRGGPVFVHHRWRSMEQHLLHLPGRNIQRAQPGVFIGVQLRQPDFLPGGRRQLEQRDLHLHGRKWVRRQRIFRRRQLQPHGPTGVRV